MASPKLRLSSRRRESTRVSVRERGVFPIPTLSFTHTHACCNGFCVKVEVSIAPVKLTSGLPAGSWTQQWVRVVPVAGVGTQRDRSPTLLIPTSCHVLLRS